MIRWKGKKLRHSFATYQKDNESPVCYLTEMAKEIAASPCNIPERINLTRATELQLLAKQFLSMEKRLKKIEVKETNK